MLWFLSSHEDMFIVHIINFVFLAAAIIYYAVRQPKKYLFNSKERGRILQGYDEFEKKLSGAAEPTRTLVVSDEQFIALTSKRKVEFNDLLQISRLGQFEGGCVATVRSENDAGYSIEVRIRHIMSGAIELEIVE